jgi:hypothetical protein
MGEEVSILGIDLETMTANKQTLLMLEAYDHLCSCVSDLLRCCCGPAASLQLCLVAILRRR